MVWLSLVYNKNVHLISSLQRVSSVANALKSAESFSPATV